MVKLFLDKIGLKLFIFWLNKCYIIHAIKGSFHNPQPHPKFSKKVKIIVDSGH